ncbi:MAG TPA: CHAT domain-containing protein, partial [Thermoanaerobaculia bacterium]
AILAVLPAGKTFRATGFAATRQMVARGALRGFRILHFATHSILDDRQPLLSSLALSRLDSTGRQVEGDLTASEIYDLNLPAELVVLSACDTALGREVPGEGLVSGLPRAFLYAGAFRVVVSLWPVEDLPTRDLMKRFYHGLFAEGLAPAQALQEAQRALRQAGRRPHEWAGFVLLGDWRPLPPFSG